MSRVGTVLIIVFGLAFLGVAVRGDDDDDSRRDHGDSRVERGLAISPVPVRVT
jgi:hypothetical protein